MTANLAAGSPPSCPFPACEYMPAGTWDLGDHLMQNADAPEHLGVWQSLQHARPVPAMQAVQADDPFAGWRVVGEVAKNEQPDPARLGWGWRVFRLAESYTSELIAEMPCCPRDRKPGRGVRLPWTAQLRPVWAPCQQHRLLWQVVVNPDDFGEGWFAVFDCLGDADTVAAVALSRCYTTSLA